MYVLLGKSDARWIISFKLISQAPNDLQIKACRGSMWVYVNREYAVVKLSVFLMEFGVFPSGMTVMFTLQPVRVLLSTV